MTSRLVRTAARGPVQADPDGKVASPVKSD